jgi:hypothetical protein
MQKCQIFDAVLDNMCYAIKHSMMKQEAIAEQSKISNV